MNGNGMRELFVEKKKKRETARERTQRPLKGVLVVRGTQLHSGSARGCSPRHQGRGR